MLASIVTLVLAFAVLIALMIIHEYGHFIIAKKFGVRVDEFGIGYPPRLFGKKFGETLYSINLIPLGAFVRIHGEEGGLDDYRSFANLKIWKRVLIVIGGVAAFWLAAMVIFSVVFAIGADLPVGDQDVAGLANPRVVVAGVAPESPAYRAGIKPHDEIKSITVAGVEIFINTVADFQSITATHEGKEITVSLERADERMDVRLTPRVETPEGQGRVGVSLNRIASLIEKSPWYEAPFKGIAYTWQATWDSLVGLAQTVKNLVAGQALPQGAEFAGPLGITVFLANAASYGPGFFLYFIGMISVLVAIFNLLPIPALDGGKLVFLLIEKVKGTPVSPKVEQVISIFFFVVLISLSLFVTVRFDIPRISEFLQASL